MAKVQVTADGFEKLKAELHHLKQTVRMEVADAIREAKSHGDLKENAAYHEAKLNQSRLEGRISDLERAVQNAKIVERPADAGDAAFLGSKVTLEDPEFGDVFTVTLVGGFEADLDQNLVSISSPLGEAVLGRIAGETVTVEAPAGKQIYRIKAVAPE